MTCEDEPPPPIENGQYTFNATHVTYSCADRHGFPDGDLTKTYLCSVASLAPLYPCHSKTWFVVLLCLLSRVITPLLPTRPPSLTSCCLGVLMGPTLGSSCPFPATGAGWLQSTFCGTPIIVIMRAAPLISKIPPNSRQGKVSVDHCGFLSWVENS